MFAKCLETCQFAINKVGSYKIANPNCYEVSAQNNPVFLFDILKFPAIIFILE